MRAMLSVATIPGVLAQLFRVIAKTVDAWRARTRGVLPLGFCWQAIQLPTFQRIELANELLHIVPRHLVDWPLEITQQDARIIAHHRLPLALRHFMFTHVKLLANTNIVHSPLLSASPV